MSENESSEEGGFCNFICSFFSKLKLKIKLILGAIVGIFGMILFFKLRSNRNFSKILEYELKKVRSEIEIETAKGEVVANNKKLSELEEKESAIREKILELQATGDREVTPEELDKFFDERGF